MALRKDAGMAALRLGAAVDEAFLLPGVSGARSVWTFGEMHSQPGSSSIVPGSAQLTLQFRDQDTAILDRMTAALEQAVAEANRDPRSNGVRVTIESGRGFGDVAGVRTDEGLQAHLALAAEAHAPGSWVSMPSGAGHDAQVVHRVLPVAMLFVPSIKGVSHNFEEDTADAEVGRGCAVFADAVASALQEANGLYGAGAPAKL
jgi:N-carbamoyl-L-amino-acid hydrolase